MIPHEERTVVSGLYRGDSPEGYGGLKVRRCVGMEMCGTHGYLQQQQAAAVIHGVTLADDYLASG